MVRWPALALVLTTALFAGCTDAGTDGDQLRLADGTTLDVTGGVSATTGAIAGVVVDEAIRPIAGAFVTLQATQANATTDDNGVFRFTDLQPAFYAFQVTAAGFLPIQGSADVLANTVTPAKVQLIQDLSPQPYHQTYAYDGLMQAWAGIGQFAAEIFLEGGSGLCDCRLTVQPEGNLTDAVVEAYWTHSLPDPAGLAEYYLSVEEVGPDGFLETQYCFSPCLMHLTASDMAWLGGPIEARLDGADAWPSYNQQIQLYVTLFYNGPAPVGWTLNGA